MSLGAFDLIFIQYTIYKKMAIKQCIEHDKTTVDGNTTYCTCTTQGFRKWQILIFFKKEKILAIPQKYIVKRTVHISD